MNPRVAIVVAEYNLDITGPLLDGAQDELKTHGVLLSEQDVVWVPGAVELPVVAQELALLGCYDAVIIFGAVIKGETDHYEYVCQYATQGCQQASLTTRVPIIFGVLTTPTRELALARVGGDRGHHGREAAQAAIKMTKVMAQIKQRAKALTEI
jgi:6,7-dimethyl-8-ribityllumazine synthase